MKVWKVEFTGYYPVGNCLIIAAEDYWQAEEIAKETLTKAGLYLYKNCLTEVDLSKQGVIEFLSGNY